MDLRLEREKCVDFVDWLDGVGVCDQGFDDGGVGSVHSELDGEAADAFEECDFGFSIWFSGEALGTGQVAVGDIFVFTRCVVFFQIEFEFDA